MDRNVAGNLLALQTAVETDNQEVATQAGLALLGIFLDSVVRIADALEHLSLTAKKIEES
jgi:hypothetical protein